MSSILSKVINQLVRLPGLRWLLPIVLISGFVFAACSTTPGPSAQSTTGSEAEANVTKENLLEEIVASGTLKVVTREAPSTWFRDSVGIGGYEYELISAFARSLGVEVEFKIAGNHHEVFEAVASGQAHLAAAGLIVNDFHGTQYGVEYTEAYHDTEQLVIYRAGKSRPFAVEDLIGKRVMVMANSSQAELLRSLQQDTPALSWAESSRAQVLDLLELLENGEVDSVIVDSTEYLLQHGLFPGLRVGFKISEPQPVAWAIRTQESKHGLLDAANRFIEQYERIGELALLQKKVFGHTPEINPKGLLTFTRYIDRRLSRYQGLIQEVANEENLDWRLLAAISYQESHWNPAAVSPTGVRGMMMLTKAAAAETGVDDRTDVEQSLRGGARYLKRIQARIAKNILEPDRTWFALAAYNVGLGHLEDARILAQRAGANPNSWADVKQQLPLLTKKQWYSQTRHGYARGHEPVAYVRNIRRYFSILAVNEIATMRPQFVLTEVSHVPALAGDDTPLTVL